MVNENSFEIGRIFVMEGSRQVLVKVVLFQLRGRGHPQNNATPNFFPDSKSSILGLSNEESIISECFCKHGRKQKISFPFSEGVCIFFHKCTFYLST